MCIMFSPIPSCPASTLPWGWEEGWPHMLSLQGHPALTQVQHSVAVHCGHPKWMTWGSLFWIVNWGPLSVHHHSMMQKAVKVPQRQVSWCQGTPASSHWGFQVFLSSKEQNQTGMTPHAQAEKGARMKMKACRVLLLSQVSPRGEPSGFSSPPRPRLQTSSYIRGINLASTAGPGERRWPCKHLKLEPTGQPSFLPPLQKPQSWRLRGDRRHSLRETSHILSFPQPVQAPSCHGDAAAPRCDGCR